MPETLPRTPRPYLAQCPGCAVYARFWIERGEGYVVIFCPLCGPVVIAGLFGRPPARYSRRRWPSAYGRRAS
jgi:hypothetical protein